HGILLDRARTRSSSHGSAQRVPDPDEYDTTVGESTGELPRPAHRPNVENRAIQRERSDSAEPRIEDVDRVGLRDPGSSDVGKLAGTLPTPAESPQVVASQVVRSDQVATPLGYDEAFCA